MGKVTPRSFEILVLSAVVCQPPAWPAVGMRTCHHGVSQAGRGICLKPMGQWESWCCPALLCPPLFYPGYLSTLSQGLQCPLLTIKAELGSPQCCLRLTPVGTLLGAFGR